MNGRPGKSSNSQRVSRSDGPGTDPLLHEEGPIMRTDCAQAADEVDTEILFGKLKDQGSSKTWSNGFVFVKICRNRLP